MSTIKTTFGKGARGHAAQTEIQLSDQAVLLLTTEKAVNGEIVSQAQVCKRVSGLLCHDLFGSGDFRRTIVRSSARCTAANVVMQHTLAEDLAAQLAPEIANFYGAKLVAQANAAARARAASQTFAAHAA